jgi:hypothetical protein
MIVPITNMALLALHGLTRLVRSDALESQILAIALIVVGTIGVAQGLFFAEAWKSWYPEVSPTQPRVEVERAVYFACSIALLMYGVWLTATAEPKLGPC